MFFIFSFHLKRLPVSVAGHKYLKTCRSAWSLAVKQPVFKQWCQFKNSVTEKVPGL